MSKTKKLVLNIIIWAVIGVVVSVILLLISHFAEIEIAPWVFPVAIGAIGGMTSWQITDIIARKKNESGNDK